ncbi:hypothetical protein [Serratia ficaria]|uniref:hypothetical protein n=1 Tax=Serratia ficaria TaxID=61651 RepID=UPI002176F9DA|nr:hypothetical protein [Serratia ficaria]CAI0792182.1 Uncharacterised protein [Serratia ficaria]CAI1238094.1 Uncharacterised protein [Serratia ficaria]CAI2024494.1 Uncharacterised protein [Serratia ficaria]CAI2408191.1 Uncharacterised protein [Serratia ficaria]CAI2438642.1 Uncharacterised protein [Serratia ficaria]
MINPTKLVNTLGWLQRRNIVIKHLNLSRAQPIVEVAAPDADLKRKAHNYHAVSAATIQGCIIYWR